MIQIIDKIIKLENKKIALFEELKDALSIEASEFVVNQVKMSRGLRDDYDYYFLIHKDSREVKFGGNSAQIQKYLDKRKITKVYWRKLKH